MLANVVTADGCEWSKMVPQLAQNRAASLFLLAQPEQIIFFLHPTFKASQARIEGRLIVRGDLQSFRNQQPADKLRALADLRTRRSRTA